MGKRKPTRSKRPEIKKAILAPLPIGTNSQTVAVIDLRKREFTLLRGTLRLVGGNPELTIGSTGGWTLQALTHSHESGVRLMDEPLILMFDELRANVGYVGTTQRLVLPLDLVAAGLFIGSVLQADAGAQQSRVVAVLFPQKSRLVFRRRHQQLNGVATATWINDDRGDDTDGPWVVLPPAVKRSRPGAA